MCLPVFLFVSLIVCVCVFVCVINEGGGRARQGGPLHLIMIGKRKGKTELDAAPEDTTNGVSADIRGAPLLMKIEATIEQIAN